MQKNQGDLYRYPVDGLSRRRQGFKSPWGRQENSGTYMKM